MKRVLSQTIALVYGVGLSLSIASNDPFSNDSSFGPGLNSTVPTIQPSAVPDVNGTRVRIIVPSLVESNEQPLDGIKDEKPQPSSTNSSQAYVRHIISEADGQIIPLIKAFPQHTDKTMEDLMNEPLEIRDTTTSKHTGSHPRQKGGPGAIIESQESLQEQLEAIKNVTQDYLKEKKKVENEIAVHKKNRSEKQTQLDKYNEFIDENNLKGTNIEQYREIITKQRDKLGEEKQQEIKEKNDVLKLLLTKPMQLEAGITAAEKELKSLEEKLSNLNAGGEQKALQAYEQMLSRKVTTDIPLTQFGQRFPQGLLWTRGEAGVIFTKIGLAQEIVDNDDAIDLLMGVFIQKMIDPVSYLYPLSSLTNSTVNKSKGQFLVEFDDAVESVKALTRTNYVQNCKALVALWRLMEKSEILLSLDKTLVPNETYKHLTTNVLKYEKNDKKSRFLRAFFKEGFLSDSGINENPKTEHIKTLMQQIKPTYDMALILVTRSIISTPTPSDKIYTRVSFAAQAMQNILLSAGKPDPIETNKLFTRTFEEAIYDTLSSYFLDNVSRHLIDVQQYKSDQKLSKQKVDY